MDFFATKVPSAIGGSTAYAADRSTGHPGAADGVPGARTVDTGLFIEDLRYFAGCMRTAGAAPPTWRRSPVIPWAIRHGLAVCHKRVLGSHRQR